MKQKKVYNINGKSFSVPCDTIELYKTKLKITEREAVEMYLEEEGKIYNEEYEELNKKADNVSREFTQTPPKKSTKPRKKKDTSDPIKENFIKDLEEWLLTRPDTGCIEITNPTKIIEFDLGETRYKIDLIRRKK